MSPDFEERLKLYLEGTGRASRIAAQNCRLNHYIEVALQHENEAAMSERLLKELDKEGEQNSI